MPNRKKDRRARSRRRSGGASVGTGVVVEELQGASQVAGQPDTPKKRKARGSTSATRTTQAQRAEAKRQRANAVKLDQSGRPQAPWHPLPLSELLILAGAIATIIGLRRGPLTNGQTTMLLGIAAVTLGTLEGVLREHLGGYRSHTVMLSLLPVVLLHSVILLMVSIFAATSRTLNVALLAVDFILFLVLFRMMRARFIDARRARPQRRW